MSNLIEEEVAIEEESERVGESNEEGESTEAEAAEVIATAIAISEAADAPTIMDDSEMSDASDSGGNVVAQQQPSNENRVLAEVIAHANGIVVASSNGNSNGDVNNDNNNDNEMGYEDCPPPVRRGSMTHLQETERRASIRAVMADPTMSPVAKRRSIQHLMDGRRYSMSGSGCGNSGTTVASSVCSSNRSIVDVSWPAGGEDTSNNTTEDMGYGDGAPYGHGGGHGDAAGAGEEDAHHVRGGGAICNEQTRHAEQTRPHCPHYERNCTMVAPCCGAAFGCRICHDECDALYVFFVLVVSLCV
jgi:hypothetical protein